MRIVIIEDTPAVQEALKAALSQIPNLEIVGIASSCRDALDLVQRTQPDVVSLDLMLEDGSSIPIIGPLRQARPGLTIVVFSMVLDPAITRKALRAGATHCLDKKAGVMALADLLTGLLLPPPDRK